MISKSNTKYIPYGHQCIDDDDISAVVDILKSDWLTSGPAGFKFENEFSKKTGSRYSVSCCNATAALHLATLAIGLGPKNRVIIPAITFAATANAVRYAGAEVIFCDVEKDTGLISLEHAELILKNEAESISAIFPVHLNGQSPDLEYISYLAEKYDLFIVEDACHAIGGSYIKKNGQKSTIGNCEFSDMTVFSFHPVKTITSGEGGIINTNNEKIYNKLSRMRSHGITKNESEFENKENAYSNNGILNPWYYEQIELGFNYKLSDINCALATSQLKKIDKFSESRKRLSQLYDGLLESLKPNIIPVRRNKHSEPCWHIYPVLIDYEKIKIERFALMNKLKKKGIITQVHYIPIYKHPYYKKILGNIALPNSEYYYDHVLTLPLFPLMSEDDVQYIVDELRNLVINY